MAIQGLGDIYSILLCNPTQTIQIENGGMVPGKIGVLTKEQRIKTE